MSPSELIAIRRASGLAATAEPQVRSAAPLSSAPAAVAPAVPLSACIITLNEEDRIVQCIDSLSFCDEIVVIDAHSSDHTRALAAQRGARVIERDWPGYRTQKEFAVRAAKHDWVLCVDADERVSESLREQIIAWRRDGFADYSGFSLPRVTEYFGQFLRHGNVYPDRLIRLFDRRCGGWRGNEIHENTRVLGRVGRLTGELEHYSYRSLTDQSERLQRYAKLMADSMHARGRRVGLARIIVNPLWRFLRGYLLRGGFLDGWRGLIFAYMEAEYVRQKYMRLYLLGRNLRP